MPYSEPHSNPRPGRTTAGARHLPLSGPSAPLPSVRELAESLGIHHNTVAHAYRVLAKDGWVQIADRRGVLVDYRERPPTPDDDAHRQEGKRLRHLVAELRGKGLSDRWIVMEVAAALEVQD